jgi:hypothetical protein
LNESGATRTWRSGSVDTGRILPGVKKTTLAAPQTTR